MTITKYFSKSDRPSMHKAVCNKCGKDCEVPFKPTGERPVFCSECFEKSGEKRGGRNSRGSGFGRRDSGRNNRRDSSRGRREYRRDDRSSDMYSAVCDKCGKDCQVPFQPSADKPVFCDFCFREKNNRNERRGERREYRRDDRRGRGGYDRRERRPKEMFATTCDKCKKDCEVPFRPSGDKPVYCSECFEKKDKVVQNKGTNYEGKSKDMKQMREQIDGLHKKVNRIMEMLEKMNPGEEKPEKKKAKKKEEIKVQEDVIPKKEEEPKDQDSKQEEIKEKKEPKKKKTVKKQKDDDEVKKPKKKKAVKKKKETKEEVEEVKEEEKVEDKNDEEKESEAIVFQSPEVKE